MACPERFLFTAFLIVAAAIHGIQGDALVSGTVFCDRCKDGRVTLFDYPLNGKISIFFAQHVMTLFRYRCLHSTRYLYVYNWIGLISGEKNA